MANCCVGNDKEVSKINNDINKSLQKDKQDSKKEIKILLLGTGESGKSTILKQMRLIHEKSFLEEEILSFRDTIFVNIIKFMKQLLAGMLQLGISLHDPEAEKEIAIINDSNFFNANSPQVAHALKTLWADEGIRLAYSRRNEFHINETSKHYMDCLDRILAADYTPTNQDILYSRFKTCGIIEHKIKVGDLLYRMVDVGGQRSQRRKWFHCFEGVTAVLFISAISEYDQLLEEDNKTNRLEESMTLFDFICNHKFFKKSCMILFLNKQDIFEEKLPKSPLRSYFPNIDESMNLTNIDEAKKAIMSLFMTYPEPSSPKVYAHFTCATDTKQIEFVMTSVNSTIIQSNLQSAMAL